MKRDSKIDIIKGIGIILMVGGHSGMPARSFIYLFHMAIFFIASGYCFNDKHSSNFKQCCLFILKRIRSLWIPYTFAVIGFSVLHNLFVEANIFITNELTGGGGINMVN